jgi:hypothetical protein
MDSSHDAEALYAAVKWIQPQARKSCRCCCLELFRLQPHQDSSYTSHVSGHGRWRDGSTLERGGPCSPLGGLRVAEGGKSGVNEMAISLV